MTVDEYWQKLEAIGWLKFLPPDRHAEIRAHLAKNLADGKKYGVYALAATGFDTECIYEDGDYKKILEELAESSLGAFAPTEIKDHIDAAAGVAEVSFTHAGRQFSCEVPCTSDWFEMDVLDLVNDALAASGAEGRFIPLPALDQIMLLAFVPPDIYERAGEEKLISRKNSYLDQLRKREALRGKQVKKPVQIDDKLLAKLRSKKSGDRHVAVLRLGQTRAKAKAAMPYLVEALKDPDLLVRNTASDGLARVGQEAVPILEKLLEQPDGGTRVRAACNLLRIGNHAGAVQAVAQFLGPEADEGLKGCALYHLADMRASAAPMLPALIRALDDPSEQVRREVHMVLRVLGPRAEKALPRLMEQLDSRDQREALCTISQLGPAAAVAMPELLRVLRNGEEIDRTFVINALGNFGAAAHAAASELVKALQDSRTVAYRAAEALGRIGPPAPGAAPGLLKLLEDKSVMVRTIAAKTLSVLDPVEAKKALSTLLKDYQEHTYEREKIAEIARAIDPEVKL